jgi:hypothetical protein
MKTFSALRNKRGDYALGLDCAGNTKMSDETPKEQAREYLQRAHEASGEFERVLLLKMADAWKQLASATDKTSETIRSLLKRRDGPSH